MSEDILKDKAQKALDDAEEKKLYAETYKRIKKELKERFPDKKYPIYVVDFIMSSVYHKEPIGNLADRLGMHRTTLYHRIDSDIYDYIDELRAEQIRKYDNQIFNLIYKAEKVYEELLEKADSDATRLKAAESILKKYAIINDIQRIEHSGEIKVPNINIISTKEK